MSTTLLDLDQLAERWRLSPSVLRHRLRSMNLPAVNVGTKRTPSYRFRLAAIERWEAANEQTLTAAEPAEPVPTGAPEGLEDYDPFAPQAPKGRARKARA